MNDVDLTWTSLEDWGQSGERCLRTNRAFSAGQVLTRFWASESGRTPTYLTVQTGESEHICLAPEVVQYINHSCAPNVFFDTREYVLIALRDIEPGSQLTYFYPSTEWSMARPFQCRCESPDCLGLIQGASAIPMNILRRYRLAAHVEILLARASAADPARVVGP